MTIPPAIRFTTRFYVTAALIAAAFFFGSTCGQREAAGDALRQHRADSIRYVRMRDSLVQEVLTAEAQRIHAERKADSLAAVTVAQAERIRASAPPRIAVQPRTDTLIPTDLVDVCIGDEGCYPSHRRVAEVTAALDSLLNVEVIGKLIPSMDAERQAWKDALHKANVERRLENDLRRAAEARVAQLEATVAQLRPSKWDRAKPYVFGTLGVILGAAVAR